MPRGAPENHRRWSTYFNPETLPFWSVHLAAVVGVVVTGWSTSGALLALGSYTVRMFFITGVYHRYFSHRTYKTSRWFQALLAFLGETCAQKGPLWWAQKHRHHHKYSDKIQDTHSAFHEGFLWAHMGWILAPRDNATDTSKIKDLTRFSELVFLEKYWGVPPLLLAAGLYLAVAGTHCCGAGLSAQPCCGMGPFPLTLCPTSGAGAGSKPRIARGTTLCWR